MSRLCCPACRIRFTVLGESYLTACPECGRPLAHSAADRLLGYRLFDPLQSAEVLPEALAASLPVPPAGYRS